MTERVRPMTDDLPLTTNFFAIIVAGGSGSRMKSDIPKQFLLLNGKPILQHTIERVSAVRLPYLPDLITDRSLTI